MLHLMQSLELHSLPKDALRDTIGAWLEAAHQEAKEHFLADQNSEKLTGELSAIMDHLISRLFEYFAHNDALKISIIATGGYGRRELCPYSDIDLLFLYAPRDAKPAAALVESILYILWDLDIKLSQAHRTIEETITQAAEDIHTRTSLLDARLIAGNPSLFTKCQQHVEKEIMNGSEMDFIEAKLNERNLRHSRFGASRYMLEPNVKEGKGGLRDLHTLWWIARYVYRVDSLDELVELGHLTEEELSTFHHANQFLMRTRAHLHYLTGHADERLSFDKQLAIARAMGYKNTSPNLAITRFMRRYFIAARTVGSLTRIFCALLEDENRRKPKNPLGWLKLARFKHPSLILEGERINIKDETLFEREPVMMIKLFHFAQEESLDIHPKALQSITRHLYLIDEHFRKDPDACATFLNILQSEKGPEVTLRRMNEAGILGRFIPEFGRIIGQTQFNMYHIYTVDEHTLVALGILSAIDQGRLKEEVPLASDIMPRISQKHVLYLAVFCHDIAKGRAGDHSELGEQIAIKLGKRFGFTDDEAETAAWLVRHHLLLSATAFKRDLNDPKTVYDFVEQVQTPELLKLLLVLTVADIRAVASSVWSEWKASLMRDLFNRSMQAMGGMDISEYETPPATLKEALAESLPTLSAQSIDEYFSLGSSSFFNGYSIEQHCIIARMMMLDSNPYKNIQLHVHHDDKKSITEVIILSQDRAELFTILTGAITLSGASIIGAKLFTLKNGVAINIFHLQDVTGAPFDRPSRLAKMATYIEQAMEGKLSLGDALEQREKPYTKTMPDLPKKKAAVFIENDASNVCSVIEIAATDRIGLLYDIAHTVNRLGLSVVTAHISTYGTQAADVLYVKDAFGMKITHMGKIKEIREKLADILT